MEKKANRKRVKPQYYREALTNDEIFQRLQDDTASKQPTKKRKVAESDTVGESNVQDDSLTSGDVESHDEGTCMSNFALYYAHLYFSVSF